MSYLEPQVDDGIPPVNTSPETALLPPQVPSTECLIPKHYSASLLGPSGTPSAVSSSPSTSDVHSLSMSPLPPTTPPLPVQKQTHTLAAAATAAPHPYAFYVEGMSCGGCAARVQETLAALPGVSQATVNFTDKRASMTISSAETILLAEGRVVEMGYTVLHKAASEPRISSPLETAMPSRGSMVGEDSRSYITVGEEEEEGEGNPSWPVNRASSRPPLRRLRRGPCGCGGGNCPCGIIELPSLTEETPLLSLGGNEAAGANTAVSTPKAAVPPVDVTKRAAAGSRGKEDTAKVATTQLLIEGMSCTSCAARIETALLRRDGVRRANVNFSTMAATVAHVTAQAPLESVVACVADLGFTVSTQHTTARYATAAEEDRGVCCCSTNLRAVPVRVGPLASCYEARLVIRGMSCAACATRIERVVQAMPAVLSCTVSFATTTAVVTTRTAGAITEVEDAIRDLGYEAADVDALEPAAALTRTRDALERTREIAVHRRSLIGSAVLSIPLVVAMFLMMTTNLMETHQRLQQGVDLVQLCCTTAILFVFGRVFFENAWRSLQHGAYTMDTLVALGTGCTYVYSVIVYLMGLFGHSSMHLMTYFDTAGMLTTFMLLGRFLEARAKRSTSGALIELMSLVPTSAIIVLPDGAELHVPAGELKVGDVVRVLAGDRVPVDGTILDGFSDLDEQMVSGESMPKHKSTGATVVGGTLNITATLLVRADKVGEATMMAQVLRIVQEAQNTKPAVQRVADRIAMYFVPVVLLLSLATLIVWLLLGLTSAYPASWRGHGVSWQGFAFNFFISTVVAACPCALGLATPTAIMVGTGVGARHGVLVKSGTTLEAVRQVTCVVLDKTGTITNGRMAVVHIHVAATVLPAGLDETLVRRLVGLVEAQSTHPIAKAVSAALLPAPTDLMHGTDGVEGSRCVVVESVVTHGGQGLEAEITVESRGVVADSSFASSSHRVFVGNRSLLQGHGVPLPDAFAAMDLTQREQSRTTVLAAVDGVACVLVSLTDTPKPAAAAVIAELHRRGLRVMMVTGDDATVAANIARSVGIGTADVHAQALPTTKATIVQELQAQGQKVMFVGDGINDSPALSQANVGVALGAGTEVAIEAADAVLVRNSLVDLLNLRSLSRLTVRRIYGNFAWAFGYNVLMLPLASGMLFPLLHVQLPPLFAGAAMMLSSLSVLASSLSIRFFRPYREEDFSCQSADNVTVE